MVVILGLAWVTFLQNKFGVKYEMHGDTTSTVSKFKLCAWLTDLKIAFSFGKVVKYCTKISFDFNVEL